MSDARFKRRTLTQLEAEARTEREFERWLARFYPASTSVITSAQLDEFAEYVAAKLPELLSFTLRNGGREDKIAHIKKWASARVMVHDPLPTAREG